MNARGKLRKKRKNLYAVTLVRATSPDTAGVRVLVLECSDGKGPSTRWRVRVDATGRFVSNVTLAVDRTRLSRHVIAVRREARALALDLLRELELPGIPATGELAAEALARLETVAPVASATAYLPGTE